MLAVNYAVASIFNEPSPVELFRSALVAKVNAVISNTHPAISSCHIIVRIVYQLKNTRAEL